MAWSDMIGRSWPDREVRVEEGALRFFAKATGEENPIYTDRAAAAAQGHPNLPVPPTYLLSLDTLAPAERFWGDDLGLDLGKLLHAEQSFEYDRLLYAGETVTISSRVTDAYEKKGGRLQFFTREAEIRGEDGRRAGVHRMTLVVRHG